MTRKQFFRQKITRNKAQLLGLLCQLKQLDLVYHIDDDPHKVYRFKGEELVRTFTSSECAWLRRLIITLNRAFSDETDKRIRHTANAGAWRAVDLSSLYRRVSEEQAALQDPPRVIVEVCGGVVQCVHSSHRISSDVLDHDNAGEHLDPKDEAEFNRLTDEIGTLPYSQ